MEPICIFTPTYNRAYCLDGLYRSLQDQRVQNFYWLIVDDGSTDDTQSLVERFRDEAPFRISYIKQENGGKQRAHNTGVSLCESELFFCVDSDDILPPDATEKIQETWNQCKDDPRLAGVVGLCGSDETTPLGTNMPAGIESLTFWGLYYKHGHKGDTALVYRAEILKRFPFDVAEGEKFIAEPYVYHQIDQEFELRPLDEVLIIREYLEDGYTSNVRKVTKDNPVGYMRLKLMYIGYSDTLYLQFYNSILYQVGCILSKTKKGASRSPHKIITALAYVPAWILVKTVYR